MEDVDLPRTLPECGELVLRTADPIRKAQLTHRIYSDLKDDKIAIHGIGFAPDWPARPVKPKLVSPKEVPSIGDSDLPRSVFTLHNLAHIELNAIDLAWDTLVRFAPLRLWDDFYIDFAHVADDESRHFCWCEQRMNELGHHYGDQPVHSILWRSAQDSHQDVTARLALVSMGQEARGLDEGPRLASRLLSLKDTSSARLVEQIAHEERAHVAVGLEHFLKILHLLDEDPGVVYRGWIQHLSPFLMSGKFDHGARGEVGLPQSWYDQRHWEGNGMDLEALQALRSRLEAFLNQEEQLTTY
eukprot:g4341.t1